MSRIKNRKNINGVYAHMSTHLGIHKNGLQDSVLLKNQSYIKTPEVLRKVCQHGNWDNTAFFPLSSYSYWTVAKEFQKQISYFWLLPETVVFQVKGLFSHLYIKKTQDWKIYRSGGCSVFIWTVEFTILFSERIKMPLGVKKMYCGF